MNKNLSFWLKLWTEKLITIYSEGALHTCSYKTCSVNMHQIYRRTPMAKCDFNKVIRQLYWSHTSTWVLYCKFAAYFQSNFYWEHLWMATSFYWKIFILASTNHEITTNSKCKFATTCAAKIWKTFCP